LGKVAVPISFLVALGFTMSMRWMRRRVSYSAGFVLYLGFGIASVAGLVWSGQYSWWSYIAGVVVGKVLNWLLDRDDQGPPKRRRKRGGEHYPLGWRWAPKPSLET
jgi:membrane associated rhomboid family serine protease